LPLPALAGLALLALVSYPHLRAAVAVAAVGQ